MSSYMTIQAFAIEMQMSVDYLIQRFLDIGIIKTKFDFITKVEKEILFNHMNCNNLVTFNKFSLQRKTRSTLNISNSIGGRNKKIEVEVRKKRVYMVHHNVTEEPDFVNEDSLKSNSEYNKYDINNNESIDCFIENKLIQSDKNNVKCNELLQQNIKEDNIDDYDIPEIEYPLKTQVDRKINKESKKNFNTEQQSNKKDNIQHHRNDKLTGDHTKKNNQNDSKKIDHTSILEVTNDNRKLENTRRHHPRTRLRYRTLGKLPKQKRNNNHQRLYINTINESDAEGELCAPNRVNKNKRKHSTLIQSFSKPMKIIPRNIVIGETISVLELSNKMSIKSSYMIKLMMRLGLIVTINQIIDQETAQLVIEEMGHNAILRRENELEELIMNDCCSNFNNISIDMVNHKNNFYKNRAPIITIMGHVDHGKTSLLDYIRATKIASSELGGITQSIGAYHVNTKNGMITFLDTPGHSAFTSMRARGIRLTDIVVLVVAADDGVMPQTIEAIQHIKASNVPVIVAINKIDKSDINIDRIKHELNHYDLIPEEWGGNTQFVNISAISGTGVNDLLDTILLQSELLELKTIHYGMAKAIVIESSLDKGRGPVVTVLIREGVLKCGDAVLCGTAYGRVRAMRNEYGGNITIAGPSIPVEILGLSGTPVSGEMMFVVRNEKKAREVALYRKEKHREIKLARKQKELITENVFNNVHNNNIIKIPELNFIIKSDTQGSIEAICESVKKLSTNKITVKIISASIGNITETDSVLASTSHAIILGFNIKADLSARRIIELDHLDVRYYSVIYDLLDEVKQIIHDSLTPQYIHKTIGLAKVNNIFNSPKYGTIAGCIVIEGIIRSRKKIKIIRNNIVIHEGELESLRHFKNDVHEVKNGVECGIGIKNYHDIQSGDIIEVLDML